MCPWAYIHACRCARRARCVNALRQGNRDVRVKPPLVLWRPVCFLSLLLLQEARRLRFLPVVDAVFSGEVVLRELCRCTEELLVRKHHACHWKRVVIIVIDLNRECFAE